jgi:hypothetical protein
VVEPGAQHDNNCKEETLTMLNETMGCRPHLKKAYCLGQPNNNRDRPRPILAICENVEDRNYILQNAPKKLKGQLYQGKKVVILDDVCEATRARRKRLVPKMMEMRRQNTMAFIPFDRQPCIRYKDGSRWKTLQETDI